MTAPDLFDVETPRAQRISETMRCRRMRVLYGRGHQPDPVRPIMAGVFKRGNQLEAYGVDLLRERVPEGSVVVPKTSIETPFGTGEIDVLVTGPAGETYVYDVKSMRSPHELKPDYAWQIRAYMRFLWAQTGVRPALGFQLTLDPSTLTDTWYPLELTDDHVALIDAEEEHVRDLIRRRELRWEEYPLRECESPEVGRNRFCRMVGTCFADWQPDEADQLTDPAIEHLARRLARAQDRLTKANAEQKRAEAAAKRARAALVDAVPAGRLVHAGGVDLKRTAVPGRRTVDLAGLETAEVVDMEKLAPYVTTGAGYDRWTVKATDAAVLAVDVETCTCGHTLDEHDANPEGNGACTECDCEEWNESEEAGT